MTTVWLFKPRVEALVSVSRLIMSCAADEARSHHDAVLRLAAEHGARVDVELPARLCVNPVELVVEIELPVHGVQLSLQSPHQTIPEGRDRRDGVEVLAVELEHLVHHVAWREDDAVARDRVRLTVVAVAHAVKLACERARASAREHARARQSARERARQSAPVRESSKFRSPILTSFILHSPLGHAVKNAVIVMSYKTLQTSFVSEISPGVLACLRSAA